MSCRVLKAALVIKALYRLNGGPAHEEVLVGTGSQVHPVQSRGFTLGARRKRDQVDDSGSG